MAASTATAAASDVPTARPCRKLKPIRSIPSTEIMTVKPGEDDRTAGGGHRFQHRSFRRSGPVERGPVPGDDEERVVDADTDADHRRDLRHEARRGEDVGHDPDAGERHRDPDERGQDRQAHRDERSERDEQDDDRGDDADDLTRRASSPS